MANGTTVDWRRAEQGRAAGLRTQLPLLRSAVEELFRKASGWNRIAKAAHGRSRKLAYEQKQRALRRIAEIAPFYLRKGSCERGRHGGLVVGYQMISGGGLHAVFADPDEILRRPWCLVTTHVMRRRRA